MLFHNRLVANQFGYKLHSYDYLNTRYITLNGEEAGLQPVVNIRMRKISMNSSLDFEQDNWIFYIDEEWVHGLINPFVCSLTTRCHMRCITLTCYKNIYNIIMVCLLSSYREGMWQASIPVRKSRYSQSGNHWGPGTMSCKPSGSCSPDACGVGNYAIHKQVRVLAFVPWPMGMGVTIRWEICNSPCPLSPLISKLVMG